MNLLHPPMGWNSWDCFGASVTEREVLENALFIANNLKKYGWEYVVVDIQWFEPAAKSNEYNEGAELVMDEYSRLMPAENRFPSAANGQGFKPLADYIHSLGLKFGIHILRGIPRQAVRNKTAVMGTDVTADMIADTDSVCGWNHDMYGVDCTKIEGQLYYDSLFKLYAQWGVDFVKVDDISRPYHREEIEAVSSAIKNSGRDMVLSLSPGNTPLDAATHVREHANMWRISDDFWDSWKSVIEMFDLCRDWAQYTGGGAYADCDMLPLGRIGIRSAGGARNTNFTYDEERTVISLWSIMGSPLMFGGHLPETDIKTIELITNERIIEMCMTSRNPREVSNSEGLRIFVAEPGYYGVFNVSDNAIEYTPECGGIDLWTGKTVQKSTIPPHGVLVFKSNSTK